jgi:hypothetical protein
MISHVSQGLLGAVGKAASKCIKQREDLFLNTLPFVKTD